MAKKIRFPLEMADGVHVRTLAELKEHFDAERVVGYYLDGKLKTWLDDRYIEKEAAAVDALSRDDEALAQKLCEIFGVEYLGDLDPEEIAYRNERIARLKQLTDDPEIIKQVDIVAFDQDDLFDRYDEGRTKIILAEGEFDIPESKQNIEYVRLCNLQIAANNDAVVKAQEISQNSIEYIVIINNMCTNNIWGLSLTHDRVNQRYLYTKILNTFIYMSEQNILQIASAQLLFTFLLSDFSSLKGEEISISIRVAKIIFSFLENRIVKSFSSFEEAEKAKTGINNAAGLDFVHVWERRIEATTGNYSLYFDMRVDYLNNAELLKTILDIPNLATDFTDINFLVENAFRRLCLRRSDISEERIQELFKEKFEPLGCDLTFDDENNLYTISKRFSNML